MCAGTADILPACQALDQRQKTDEPRELVLYLPSEPGTLLLEFTGQRNESITLEYPQACVSLCLRYDMELCMVVFVLLPPCTTACCVRGCCLVIVLLWWYPVAATCYVSPYAFSLSCLHCVVGDALPPR